MTSLVREQAKQQVELTSELEVRSMLTRLETASPLVEQTVS